MKVILINLYSSIICLYTKLFVVNIIIPIQTIQRSLILDFKCRLGYNVTVLLPLKTNGNRNLYQSL